jgi:hypothetical protein
MQLNVDHVPSYRREEDGGLDVADHIHAPQHVIASHDSVFSGCINTDDVLAVSVIRKKFMYACL